VRTMADSYRLSLRSAKDLESSPFQVWTALDVSFPASPRRKGCDPPDKTFRIYTVALPYGWPEVTNLPRRFEALVIDGERNRLDAAEISGTSFVPQFPIKET
jgi:hypothetical protein